MTQTRLLTLHTLSPLHCGTGMAVGAIELPIAREKPTNIPIVPGSSLKGVLRGQAEVEGIHKAAFGPKTEFASDHAGAIQFSDARLVLMPMRSVAGIFAWTTSPYLLGRFLKDLAAAKLRTWDRNIENPQTEQGCFVAQETALKAGGRVVLEDLDFTTETPDKFENLTTALGQAFFPDDVKQQTWLAAHLCVVHNNVMGLLLDMGTELQAHVRLHPDTKTVVKGQLWQEENLPVESLLAAIVLVNGEFKKDSKDNKGFDSAQIAKHLADLCNTKVLQFGGKASVGKGLCQMRLAGGGQ